MMSKMMKIMMAVARFVAGAAVLVAIVWMSYSVGYWYAGYYMPPLPTLTEKLDPGGEEGRISLDLLQIRGIIEQHPDSRWAPIYAGWIHDGDFEVSAFKQRHGKSIEEWWAAVEEREKTAGKHMLAAENKLYGNTQVDLRHDTYQAALLRGIEMRKLPCDTPMNWRSSLS
jgi:hypothetical protein